MYGRIIHSKSGFLYVTEIDNANVRIVVLEAAMRFECTSYRIHD